MLCVRHVIITFACWLCPCPPYLRLLLLLSNKSFFVFIFLVSLFFVCLLIVVLLLRYVVSVSLCYVLCIMSWSVEEQKQQVIVWCHPPYSMQYRADQQEPAFINKSRIAMSVRLGQTLSSPHEWSVSLLAGLTLSASLIPLGLSASSTTKLPPLNNNYCIANHKKKNNNVYWTIVTVMLCKALHA